MKYLLQHGTINSNRLYSYSVSDIQDYFEYIINHDASPSDNPSMKIYINKIESTITFTIKTGYFLELLTPETMKLLGTIEKDITKDKNDENVPHLEIIGVVSATLLTMITSKIQELGIHLFQINHLVNY